MTGPNRPTLDASTLELVGRMGEKLTAHSDRAFEEAQKSGTEAVRRHVQGRKPAPFEPSPDILYRDRTERWWDPRIVPPYCDLHVFRPPFAEGSPQTPTVPKHAFDTWASAFPGEGRMEMTGVTWYGDPERIGFYRRCSAMLVTGIYTVPQGPAMLRLLARFHIQGSTTILGGVPNPPPLLGSIGAELVVGLAAYSRLDDLKVASETPKLRQNATIWGDEMFDKTVPVALDIPVGAGDIVICMAQAELRLGHIPADSWIVGANFSRHPSFSGGIGAIEITDVTAGLDC